MPRRAPKAVQTPRLVGADPRDDRTIDWVEVAAVRARLRELRGELAEPRLGVAVERPFPGLPVGPGAPPPAVAVQTAATNAAREVARRRLGEAAWGRAWGRA